VFYHTSLLLAVVVHIVVDTVLRWREEAHVKRMKAAMQRRRERLTQEG
jgi:hypothetical protein